MSTVLISTCTRESIRAETVRWMFAAKRPIDIVTSLEPIDWNRNEQVRRFLSTGYTHLFFLDSDSVPMSGTIECLLFHDKPAIIAPNLCFMQREAKVRQMTFTKPGTVDHFEHEEQTPQIIGASGMSGLLVRREVLEKIGDPWFQFHYDNDGKILVGEDIDFYRKMAEAGYDLWCDWSLVPSHYKTFDLKQIWWRGKGQ